MEATMKKLVSAVFIVVPGGVRGHSLRRRPAGHEKIKIGVTCPRTPPAPQ